MVKNLLDRGLNGFFTQPTESLSANRETLRGDYIPKPNYSYSFRTESV